VAPICRKQLADWGVDYFDLYIVHFPISLAYVDPSVRYPPSWTNSEDKLELGKATIQETWTAMESLVDQKLARSIGVSNFSAQLLMDLLRYARVRPSTLQIEHHPYLTQTRLVDYAQREGIAVTAYSSFGPLSFLELDLKDAQSTPPLFEHDVIKGLAEKYNRTPAQVLLRWATQRKIAVIPKSNNPTRLAQNLQVTDFDLEGKELEAISALDKGLRFNDPIAVSWSFMQIIDSLLTYSIVRPSYSHLLSVDLDLLRRSTVFEKSHIDEIYYDELRLRELYRKQ
jgi:D-xylose reductase